MLTAKFHQATVTDTNLEYEGSITIDKDLLWEADVLPNEKVDVYNITNGKRFSTYVIEGKRGKGDIIINGAAAHHASKGDKVIIAVYAMVEEDDAPFVRPKVLVLGKKNKIVSRK